MTFDARDAAYVSVLLDEAGLDGGGEGSSASGYWINVRGDDAVKALEAIAHSLRCREGDLSVALFREDELGEAPSQERCERLLKRLPGEVYQAWSSASLERWWEDRRAERGGS